MSKVIKITPVVLHELRPKVQKAVQAILDEYGLILNPNINASYDSNEFSFKLKIAIPGEENDSIGKNAESNLKALGLWNVRFKAKGKVYKVVDYNPRKYKFPVVITEENSNKRACCTVDYVTKNPQL